MYHWNFKIVKRRLISLVLVLSFGLSAVFPGSALGIEPQVLNLPVSGTMVTSTPAFQPILLKGMTLHPENPLQFDFIVDVGDQKIRGQQLRQESSKLIKYFLAALTVPEKEMWVNLSPYEKDRIIPESFGLTEMGRDLLAQDYILKQLTASLIYPEKDLGKAFWSQVYKKLQEQYGTTDIPINTFNKVWIVPDKASVMEYNSSVFVKESHLKVMLEEDYLSLQKNHASTTNQIGSKIIRNLILPEIEKEVNEGQNFSNLRQIYNSMILATWYKIRLKESLLGKLYVDQNKVKGIDLKDTQVKQKIYEQYLKSFKKGVYNYIKEEQDPITEKMIPRKYFSGGFEAQSLPGIVRQNSEILPTRAAMFSAIQRKDLAQMTQGRFTIVQAILGEVKDKAMTIQGNVINGLRLERKQEDAQTISMIDQWIQKLNEDSKDIRLEDLRNSLSVLLWDLLGSEDELWQTNSIGDSIASLKIKELLRVLQEFWNKNPSLKRERFEGTVQVFLDVIEKKFNALNVPRLYVFHQLLWQDNPNIGARLILKTIRHILGHYIILGKNGIDSSTSYSHILVDLLYLNQQLKIADKELSSNTHGPKTLVSLLKERLFSYSSPASLFSDSQAAEIIFGLILVNPQYALENFTDPQMLLEVTRMFCEHPEKVALRIHTGIRTYLSTYVKWLSRSNVDKIQINKKIIDSFGPLRGNDGEFYATDWVWDFSSNHNDQLIRDFQRSLFQSPFNVLNRYKMLMDSVISQFDTDQLNDLNFYSLKKDDHVIMKVRLSDGTDQDVLFVVKDNNSELGMINLIALDGVWEASLHLSRQSQDQVVNRVRYDWVYGSIGSKVNALMKAKPKGKITISHTNAAMIAEFEGKILLDPESGRIRYGTTGPISELKSDLWFIRHGSTEGEEFNRLNKKGKEQAEYAASQLFNLLRDKIKSEKEIVVLTSPLERDQETAQFFVDLVKLKLNKDLKIVIDTGVNEAGENFLDWIAKAKDWIETINEKYSKDTVVLFGDGNFSAALRAALGDQKLLDTSGYLNWGEMYLLRHAEPVSMQALLKATLHEEQIQTSLHSIVQALRSFQLFLTAEYKNDRNVDGVTHFLNQAFSVIMSIKNNYLQHRQFSEKELNQIRSTLEELEEFMAYFDKDDFELAAWAEKDMQQNQTKHGPRYWLARFIQLENVRGNFRKEFNALNNLFKEEARQINSQIGQINAIKDSHSDTKGELHPIVQYPSSSVQPIDYISFLLDLTEQIEKKETRFHVVVPAPQNAQQAKILEHSFSLEQKQALARSRIVDLYRQRKISNIDVKLDEVILTFNEPIIFDKREMKSIHMYWPSLGDKHISTKLTSKQYSLLSNKDALFDAKVMRTDYPSGVEGALSSLQSILNNFIVLGVIDLKVNNATERVQLLDSIFSVETSQYIDWVVTEEDLTRDKLSRMDSMAALRLTRLVRQEALLKTHKDEAKKTVNRFFQKIGMNAYIVAPELLEVLEHIKNAPSAERYQRAKAYVLQQVRDHSDSQWTVYYNNLFSDELTLQVREELEGFFHIMNSATLINREDLFESSETLNNRIYETALKETGLELSKNERASYKSLMSLIESNFSDIYRILEAHSIFSKEDLYFTDVFLWPERLNPQELNQLNNFFKDLYKKKSNRTEILLMNSVLNGMRSRFLKHIKSVRERIFSLYQYKFDMDEQTEEFQRFLNLKAMQNRLITAQWLGQDVGLTHIQDQGVTEVSFKISMPNLPIDGLANFIKDLPEATHKQVKEILAKETLDQLVPIRGFPKLVSLSNVENFMIQENIILRVGPWGYKLTPDGIILLDENNLEISTVTDEENLRSFIVRRGHAIIFYIIENIVQGDPEAYRVADIPFIQKVIFKSDEVIVNDADENVAINRQTQGLSGHTVEHTDPPSAIVALKIRKHSDAQAGFAFAHASLNGGFEPVVKIPNIDEVLGNSKWEIKKKSNQAMLVSSLDKIMIRSPLDIFLESSFGAKYSSQQDVFQIFQKVINDTEMNHVKSVAVALFYIRNEQALTISRGRDKVFYDMYLSGKPEEFIELIMAMIRFARKANSKDREALEARMFLLRLGEIKFDYDRRTLSNFEEVNDPFERYHRFIARIRKPVFVIASDENPARYMKYLHQGRFIFAGLSYLAEGYVNGARALHDVPNQNVTVIHEVASQHGLVTREFRDFYEESGLLRLVDIDQLNGGLSDAIYSLLLKRTVPGGKIVFEYSLTNQNRVQRPRGLDQLKRLIADAGELWEESSFIRPHHRNSKVQVQVFEFTKDKAMSSNPGGIDLDAAMLDLQIQRDEKGIPLPLSQQPIGDMKVDGFVPIITRVFNVDDLPKYIGMSN